MTPRSVAYVIPSVETLEGGGFVMNTRAELAQAFEDYRSGRLGAPQA